MVCVALFVECGSKKSIAQSETKEKTDIELMDNSKINTKIEQERQFINTDTKERIVTFYGVRFDTIYQQGRGYVIPIYYPVKTEEERDIHTQSLLDKLSVRDSTQKEIELRYKNQLEEKDKKVLESKESTQVYQISLLVVSITALLFLILLIRK
jgi:hypothetical protein